MSTLVEIQILSNKIENQILHCQDEEQLASLYRELFEVEAMELKKIEAYRQVTQSFKDKAEARAKEADALREHSKALLNHAKRIEDRLIFIMQARDKTRFEGLTFDAVLQTTPGSVDIVNDAEIPEMFKKLTQEVSIDKSAILEQLRSGHSVPGAQLKKGQRIKWKPKTSA